MRSALSVVTGLVFVLVFAGAACAQSQPLRGTITALLEQRAIEARVTGDGIQHVTVEVRRRLKQPVEVLIPVGTFFQSRDTSSQNMVGTDDTSVTLSGDGWTSVNVPAACANRPRDVPGGSDSFEIRRLPESEELRRLMPVMRKAGAPFAVRQAAVWIVTDDASYDDLGVLVASPSGFGGSRVIDEKDAARAMQICEQAGIDVTKKAIWRDRDAILKQLRPGSRERGWLARRISAAQ